MPGCAKYPNSGPQDVHAFRDGMLRDTSGARRKVEQLADGSPRLWDFGRGGGAESAMTVSRALTIPEYSRPGLQCSSARKALHDPLYGKVSENLAS